MRCPLAMRPPSARLPSECSRKSSKPPSQREPWIGGMNIFGNMSCFKYRGATTKNCRSAVRKTKPETRRTEHVRMAPVKTCGKLERSQSWPASRTRHVDTAGRQIADAKHDG